MGENVQRNRLVFCTWAGRIMVNDGTGQRPKPCTQAQRINLRQRTRDTVGSEIQQGAQHNDAVHNDAERFPAHVTG